MQLYMIQGNKIYLRIRHWSFLHTEASYFTMCALCSGDLHELLNTMAESKMKYLSRSRGEFESEWKTASHLTYLRRQIYVCAVRGMAKSLFVRLQQAGVGPGGGAAQAAKRRGQAMAREERGRRERATHWLQHTRGYRVINRGQFLTV